MTMIERVARATMDSAIAPQFRGRWDDQPDEVKTYWRFVARAAIEAMRGSEVRCPHCESWFEMEIDAAMDEPS
jgi:hypothetical protein